MINVEEHFYTPIFIDLDVDPANWRPPNAMITEITAYSPLAGGGQKHFREDVKGNILSVWQRFLDWASGERRERKFVLIALSYRKWGVYVLADNNLDRPPKCFDFGDMLNVMYSRGALPIKPCPISNLTNHYQINDQNEARRLSLIFEKVISPLPPIEGYRIITEALNLPGFDRYKTFVTQLAIKKMSPQKVIPQIVAGKNPYELVIINNAVQLLASDGGSSKICDFRNFSMEPNQTIKIFHDQSVHIYQTWQEFFTDFISVYEQNQWDVAESNDERLNLINRRLQFSDQQEVELDERFTCAISSTIMTHPQKITSGPSLIQGAQYQRFEYTYIMAWLERSKTNPFNRLPLTMNDLAPDETLTQEITEFLEEHKTKVFPWVGANKKRKV